MYGVKVDLPPKIVTTESLDNFLVGVKKRIQKEYNRLRFKSDEEYRLKRHANIQRLKIIRDEVRQLREQL